MRWAKKPISLIMRGKQRGLFDQAERKKQEGINASYHNTTTIWKEAAGEALIAVAKAHYEFTTDEIWMHLARLGIHTSENRAIGAVIQGAIRSGVIEHTGTYRPTGRPVSHKRPQAVWRSKIYVG